MSERDEDKCIECGCDLMVWEGFKCEGCLEDDYLSELTCNPDSPEECESCQ